ncbi:hypothetical protein [Rhizobium sp. SSA_523]|uniref:hypothetical protein n=1 Tax=Rhizobium sp. SSA_523 TaxID=2952477 RepID=UPI00209160BC|nr:hypothetical protein [Rhizobium sp. SSA_523]MCO5732021.1 hypothetical protein [Rhizobium sp. SSA_523]WKC22639.1 hypothetical protein QTJ18_17415 [Rhizobium sp. SSA_523]
MLKVIQATGLALAVTVAGLATSSPARAQDVELRIGPDGVRPVIRDPRDADRRRDDRRGPRGCSEREARAAARDLGLRDPEVVRVTPGRIIVEGDTRRGVRRVSFANERGCPEI